MRHRAVQSIQAASGTSRIQGIGICQQLLQSRVGVHLIEHVEHARGSATTETTPGFAQTKANLACRHTEALDHFALQQPNPQIRRDAVKAAAVHDARTRGLRHFMVRIDHAPHPRHLAAQVTIVRAGGNAGRHQG